ncbi:unnamed protein product [Ixodes hexagonus]
MAPNCATLSITEFLPGLDWRPLRFERPLPPDRVCQLCGVVGKETVVPPCFHSFCNVCFESIVHLGCRCPLDGEAFDRDDVDKLLLRPGHVLNLKAFCWNSAHGCDFVGPVSDLLKHFETDCDYHKVSCPSCCQDVLRKNFVQHYVNDCDPTSASQAVSTSCAAKMPQPVVTHQKGQLLEDLEKTSADIRQSIAELKDCYYGMQSSVNTVADDVKLGRSEARQAINEATSHVLAALQAMVPDEANQEGRLLNHVERAYGKIKQSLAELKMDYYGLQAKVSNSGAGDGTLGRSEAERVITDVLSGPLTQLQQTQSDISSHSRQLLKCIGTLGADIRQSIAELKNGSYGPHDGAKSDASEVAVPHPNEERAVRVVYNCFRCNPPDKRLTDDYENKFVKVGRRCAESSPPTKISGRSDVSFSVPGCCRKVRWEDSLDFDREMNTDILSDYFVVDGEVAFLSLSWKRSAGNCFTLAFKLHVQRNSIGQPEDTFRRRLNVGVVRPTPLFTIVKMDPDRERGTQVIEVCKLTYNRPNRYYATHVKVFVEPAV